MGVAMKIGSERLADSLNNFLQSVSIVGEKSATDGIDVFKGTEEAPTSHPTGKVEDGTQKAQEGSFGAELDANVKKDIPASANAVAPQTEGTQDSHQLQIGNVQYSVGKNPSVEKDYKDKPKDPQEGTTSEVKVEGEKFSSFTDATPLPELLAALETIGGRLLKSAQFWQQPSAAAPATTKDAAQAGAGAAAQAGQPSELDHAVYTTAVRYLNHGRLLGTKAATFLNQQAIEQHRKQAAQQAALAARPQPNGRAKRAEESSSETDDDSEDDGGEKSKDKGPAKDKGGDKEKSKGDSGGGGGGGGAKPDGGPPGGGPPMGAPPMMGDSGAAPTPDMGGGPPPGAGGGGMGGGMGAGAPTEQPSPEEAAALMQAMQQGQGMDGAGILGAMGTGGGGGGGAPPPGAGGGGMGMDPSMGGGAPPGGGMGMDPAMGGGGGGGMGMEGQIDPAMLQAILAQLGSNPQQLQAQAAMKMACELENTAPLSKEAAAAYKPKTAAEKAKYDHIKAHVEEVLSFRP